MKRVLTALALALALAIGVSLPMRSSSAQFIDRIVRPCTAGAVVIASVIVNPGGNGNVDVTPCTGGSLTVNGASITTSPGGSNTQIQYNDSGVFNGNAAFTFNKAATSQLVSIVPTWNSAGTTFTALKVNPTNTASAVGSLLLDLETGGTTVFQVDKFGNVTDGGGYSWARPNARLTITTSANGTPLTLAGYSLIVADQSPGFSLSGTWNTSGTPTAILANITDTASNAASLLMDLRVGGSSKFSVSKAGVITVTGCTGCGGVTATGTVNTVPKVTNATGPVYGDSQISDDGTTISMFGAGSAGIPFSVNTTNGNVNIGDSFTGTKTSVLALNTTSILGDANIAGNGTTLTVDDAAREFILGGANATFYAANSGVNFGKTSNPIPSVFIGNAANNSAQLTGTFTGNRVATFPDFTGTVGILLTNNATLNFGNLVAIGCEDLTVTVTGAADGDTVSLGVPNASIVANSSWSAWVSSANTVTIRFCALVSGDPASGSFRVDVWKH